MEVKTFDISGHGVSFDSTFPLAVGDEYIYEIGFGDRSIICDVRIVACRAGEKGTWRVGADFI
jgi:hypothetical protein